MLYAGDVLGMSIYLLYCAYVFMTSLSDFVGLLPCLALLSLSVRLVIGFLLLLPDVIHLLGCINSWSVHIQRSDREASSFQLGFTL